MQRPELNARENRVITSEQLLNMEQRIEGNLNEGEILFENYNLASLTNGIQILLITYSANSGLSHIVTHQGMEELKTEEGIKKFYDKGKKVMKQVDNLNIPQDMNELMSVLVTHIKNKCYKKFPAYTKQCDSVEDALKQSMGDSTHYLTNLFEGEKKRVHAEYEILKCMYEDYWNCQKTIDKFGEVEKEVQKIASSNREAFIENLIDKVTSITIAP